MKNKFVYYLLILFFSINACKDNLHKTNTVVDKSAMDTEKADSVTILYSNKGKLKAKLQAKTFIHVLENTEPYVEMKDSLKMIFFGDNKEVTSTITALRGRYFEANNNVLLRDSVKIINNKNEELHTSELVWNEASKQFFTEKFVTIKTPTQIIFGDGMEANQDFSYYKILNPKGIIAIKKDKIPN